ncbi:MAG: energy transducer TonB [Puniceicoccales bacterium]|jgi:protein TonB|nr:energy transducer TonB [Puniceicoccales bacterium]
MRIDLIIGILLATGIHAFVAYAHILFPGRQAAAPADSAPPPVIALAPLPQLDPEPPEQEEAAPPPEEAAPETAAPDLAPPMQADVPAPAIQTAFQQTLQPPPPPSLGAAAAITIPRAGFSAKPVSLRNVFDFSQLDEKPAKTFFPQPQYPYEMRRSRLSGTVTLGFSIDESGAVISPFVVRSTNAGFETEALRTISRWKFRPGKKSGKPVATRRVLIDVEFSFPGD